MAVALSPSVTVNEFDLTGIVPGVSTTEGGLAGGFNWGPVNVLTLVESEGDLIKRFGSPTNGVANDWFTAANFLSYGNLLWIVRAVNETSANTAELAKNATCGNSAGFLVRNDDEYTTNYDDGSLQTEFSVGEWIAKYAGDLGNSLKVSVCSGASAYQSNLTGTVTATANSAVVTGTSTLFTAEVTVGDLVVINNEVLRVTAVTSNTSLTTASRIVSAATAASATRRWEYYNEVDTTPSTSVSVADVGGSNDEMHIAIIDEDGRWTGQTGSVLEVYQYVSKASDALRDDGSTNYYKEVVNQSSQYVRWASHSGLVSGAGSTSHGTTFGSSSKPINHSLVGGNNGKAVSNAERERGWSYFINKEDVEVSILMGSDCTQTVATYLINNIAEVRQDCIVFLSPPRAYVVNAAGNEVTNCVAYRNTLPSTSYAALDNNWKYQYDRYNDLYRYVPMNGDIAGIHVRSDVQRDAWWAAAGLNRGQVKNVIKLAWNPKQGDRDILYKNGINPVCTFNGDGTVLFGQKTLLAKPSAFDRINVRRLFIVLEKAISRAARYFLFEFNDPITRAQFRNMVEPFLRDVQGRRGIYDFKVVCDETNNTGEVIDRNEFVGDIYIKPARAAEFITLNFVATRTSVDFSQVIGQF
jgi:hypothetical protein